MLLISARSRWRERSLPRGDTEVRGDTGGLLPRGDTEVRGDTGGEGRDSWII